MEGPRFELEENLKPGGENDAGDDQSNVLAIKESRLFSFTCRVLLFSSRLWGDVSPPAVLSYRLLLVHC